MNNESTSQFPSALSDQQSLSSQAAPSKLGHREEIKQSSSRNLGKDTAIQGEKPKSGERPALSNHLSQKSDLSQEQADQVMSLPSYDVNEAKVIESRTICYCSNFDINVNDWFNEYENIEIFKINMKKNLGSMWLKYFQEALQFQGKRQLKDEHFFTVVFNFYLINYYSPASPEQFKQSNNTEQVFDKYYQEICELLNSRKYIVIDQNLLKSLIFTFYTNTQKELHNIQKKIESDHNYQIQLTEHALAQYNQMLRHEALLKREIQLDQQRKKQMMVEEEKPKVNQVSNFMSQNFAGLTMIKDRVIKPLLIATEKVVEYCFPEDHEASNNQMQASEKQEHQNFTKKNSTGGITKTTVDDSSSEVSELTKIKRRLQRLDLNSIDDASSFNRKLESPKSNKTLKKRRFRQLERYNIDEDFLGPMASSENSLKGSSNQKPKSDRKSLKLNEKMLKKASATIDLISQKVKRSTVLQETVSASFVTNVIELTNDAYKTLQKQDMQVFNAQSKDEQNIDMNLRFIKPSQVFYNDIMSYWFKYLHIIEEQKDEQENVSTSNKAEINKGFIEFTTRCLTKIGQWSDDIKIPLEKFSQLIVQEYYSLKGFQQEEELHFSMCTFFNNIKAQMLSKWENDIIKKSSQFQQHSAATI